MSDNIISWIHLSDLHLHSSDNEQYDKEKLFTDKLIDDVQDQIYAFNYQLSPDFVLISGDLAYSGGKEEYKVVQQFLIDLSEKINVPLDHFVMVPGNHDVDWAKTDPDWTEPVIRELLQKDDKSIEDQVKTLMKGDNSSLLARRLESYQEFSSQYHVAARSIGDVRNNFCRIWDTKGIRLTILALSSTWLSTKPTLGSKDHDLKKLLIDFQSVRDWISSTSLSEFNIIISHHPSDWLHKASENFVNREFRKLGDFLLTGHEHSFGYEDSDSPDGRIIQIQAGATYQRDSRISNRYNLVSLNLTKCNGKVVSRLYSWESEFWTYDSVKYKSTPDGVIVIEKLPSVLCTPTALKKASPQIEIDTTQLETWPESDTIDVTNQGLSRIALLKEQIADFSHSLDALVEFARDPDVIQSLRQEVARIQKGSNSQLDDFRERLLSEHDPLSNGSQRVMRVIDTTLNSYGDDIRILSRDLSDYQAELASVKAGLDRSICRWVDAILKEIAGQSATDWRGKCVMVYDHEAQPDLTSPLLVRLPFLNEDLWSIPICIGQSQRSACSRLIGNLGYFVIPDEQSDKQITEDLVEMAADMRATYCAGVAYPFSIITSWITHDLRSPERLLLRKARRFAAMLYVLNSCDGIYQPETKVLTKLWEDYCQSRQILPDAGSNDPMIDLNDTIRALYGQFIEGQDYGYSILAALDHRKCKASARTLENMRVAGESVDTIEQFSLVHLINATWYGRMLVGKSADMSSIKRFYRDLFSRKVDSSPLI